MRLKNQNVDFLAAARKKREAQFAAPASSFGERIRLAGRLVESARRAGQRHIAQQAKLGRQYRDSNPEPLGEMIARGGRAAARATVLSVDFFLEKEQTYTATLLDLRTADPLVVFEFFEEHAWAAFAAHAAAPPPPPHLPAAFAGCNIAAKILPAPRLPGA